jgi:hypothetical protein
MPNHLGRASLLHVLLFTALTVATAIGAAPKAGKKPQRRAKPPEWPAEVLDAFFTDAREHLVGERPAAEARRQAAGTPSTDVAEPGSEWSDLAKGETLSAEVKRLAADLRTSLANRAKFNAGGFKQCRADCGVLATVFAVIDQYEGEVRWKADAATMRDALSGASRICQAPTDEAFAEVTRRLADLEELIRGGRLAASSDKELGDWSSLSDRSLLMHRMEQALEERISPALASAKEFNKRADQVREEAEMLAVLSKVICRPTNDYWDDEGFVELADQLCGAARALRDAANSADYDAARAAAGRASGACSACHEGYRG